MVSDRPRKASNNKRPALCVHGHFYQPPRENPWTGRVELQPSAAPAHDWNERITDECYRPNTAVVVPGPDAERRISNYAHMSFDFGPTLLAYLAREQRPVHDDVVAADRRSRERFGGHGSAVAQSYSHAILPLACERDRRTEIRWGLRDFELRFGRASEGLWLPECAVDTATLEAVADEGVRFVILAPGQAAKVRRIGDERWHPVNDGGVGVDTRRAYRVPLASGRSIAAFFYDGGLAHAVAFGSALRDGAAFLAALEQDLPEAPALVHLATDGETYGHHHAFAELGLAYVLDRVAGGENAFDLTVYGEHLAAHPPTHEVEIAEKSSWSCAHGIERWRSHCGCNGGRREGSQHWRGPLREALDTLRDALAVVFEREGRRFFDDPWQARDAYVDVLTRDDAGAETAFLGRCTPRPLHEAERRRAFELLELQRHALLMYASCAWFFDDLADIEPMQALAHAARAVELVGAAERPRIERLLRSMLARSRSNDGDPGDALYDRVLAAAHGEAQRRTADITPHREAPHGAGASAEHAASALAQPERTR